MYRLLFGIMQGLKYRFLRIYRDFDFTDISEISEKYRWIFFHKYR